MDAMSKIAYGDLASALLALVAVLFLRYRWSHAIAVAWLANVVTGADWVLASYLAASSQLATYRLGGNRYIANCYVPVLAVIHVMIFSRLLKHPRRGGSGSA